MGVGLNEPGLSVNRNNPDTCSRTKVNGVGVQYKDFVFTDNQSYAGWYMLFTWFWTTQFIVAMGQLVVALSVVTWYCTHEPSRSRPALVAKIRANFTY